MASFTRVRVPARPAPRPGAQRLPSSHTRGARWGRGADGSRSGWSRHHRGEHPRPRRRPRPRRARRVRPPPTWPASTPSSRGSGSIPLIYSRTGQPLRPDLAARRRRCPGRRRAGRHDVGPPTGDHRPHRARAPTTNTRPAPCRPPGSGWPACSRCSPAGSPAGSRRAALQQLTIGLLLLSVVVGVLPFGRLAVHRVLVAPAFAAAAAFAVLWDPDPERLPTDPRHGRARGGGRGGGRSRTRRRPRRGAQGVDGRGGRAVRRVGGRRAARPLARGRLVGRRW